MTIQAVQRREKDTVRKLDKRVDGNGDGTDDGGATPTSPPGPPAPPQPPGTQPPGGPIGKNPQASTQSTTSTTPSNPPPPKPTTQSAAPPSALPITQPTTQSATQTTTQSTSPIQLTTSSSSILISTPDSTTQSSTSTSETFTSTQKQSPTPSTISTSFSLIPTPISPPTVSISPSLEGNGITPPTPPTTAPKAQTSNGISSINDPSSSAVAAGIVILTVEGILILAVIGLVIYRRLKKKSSNTLSKNALWASRRNNGFGSSSGGNEGNLQQEKSYFDGSGKGNASRIVPERRSVKNGFGLLNAIRGTPRPSSSEYSQSPASFTTHPDNPWLQQSAFPLTNTMANQKQQNNDKNRIENPFTDEKVYLQPHMSGQGQGTTPLIRKPISQAPFQSQTQTQPPRIIVSSPGTAPNAPLPRLPPNLSNFPPPTINNSTMQVKMQPMISTVDWRPSTEKRRNIDALEQEMDALRQAEVRNRGKARLERGVKMDSLLSAITMNIFPGWRNSGGREGDGRLQGEEGDWPEGLRTKSEDGRRSLVGREV